MPRVRFRHLLIFLLGLYLIGMLGVAFLFRKYSRELPDVEKLSGYSPSLITKIYDVRGELISELFVERRVVLPLSEIPLDFQRAALATEDDNFYKHWGVDLKGIFRAFLINLRAGHTVQGGSTITQQLAKNIFLSQARTLDRKVKELLLTLQMERHFSKDEILQLYLNQIYFGHGAYGIEAAARVFFGKKAKELTLPECALLAGLPRAPNAYSPFNNPKRAFQRRSLVLRRMRNMNFINEKEELDATGKPLNVLQTPLTPAVGSYFVEYVRRLLEPKYGSEAMYRSGLSVYTTLDLRMQKAAEQTANAHLGEFDNRHAEDRLIYLLKNKKITQDYFNKWKKNRSTSTADDVLENEENAEPLPVQGALVAIDPQTGGIRALVGGRDFQKYKFNRAVQAKRQPGSTFKPFVWQAALESGFTAATIVDDYPLAYTEVTSHPRLVAEATDYMMLREMVTGYYEIDWSTASKTPDPIWSPQNWDDKYLGPVTLRKGLALSRNLVSIRLIDRVGPKTVADFAKRAGIESKLDAVLSLGLGTSVVTPLELAGAFATFDNSGIRMQPLAILRVVDKDGRVLEENLPQGQAAFTPQSNYLITNLLQGVVKDGTARHAQRVGRPVAGKTGTTQDQRDVWFAGYTPGLAAVVWMGYDDFAPLGKKISSAGTTVPWWTDFMAEAVKYLPVKNFDMPPGIVIAKIDSDTGLLALPSCPHVTLEAFYQDKVPQEFCDIDHDKLLTPELEITE